MTEREWRERLGVNIAEAIDRRGCTRRETAEEMNISEKTLDHYIHGRRIPTIPGLVNLAKFLDYPIENFVDFGEKIER